MAPPSRPWRFLGWLIALTPLLAFAAIATLPFIGINCRATAATSAHCNVLGKDVEAWIQGIGMFAAWGWLVTVPTGVVVDLLLRQALPRETNSQGTAFPLERGVDLQGPVRICTYCGFHGPMPRWLPHYNQPQFLTVGLLALWVIPGLVFLWWAWTKRLCPRCGRVGNSAAV